MITLSIPIPGIVADGTAYLDIETRKVDFNKPLPDGWIMRKRWSAFAVGIAAAGQVTVHATYDEPALLGVTSEAIGNRTVAYAATRQFDEMILKGMFTNARRAHSPYPIYPSMPGASGMRWRNMRDKVQNHEFILLRSQDVAGKDVPVLWCTDQRPMVLVHLLRDVLELVYYDNKANAKARAWIRHVLYSNSYAIELVEEHL